MTRSSVATAGSSSSCSVVVLVVGLLSLGAGTSNASAAESTQASAPPDNSTLDNVVVTATRRETKLLETAGAISAISGDELKAQAITSAARIDSLVPNLRVQDQSSQGMGAIQLVLRGIGNSSFIEIGDPNVGFYVDSVYMSRPQTALNLLFDAQRMEVARGPQGTLFGRNSTVGSINVINNRPNTRAFSGDVGVAYGNYNDRVLDGVLNIPVISDKLAIRLAGFGEKRDTYFTLRADDLVNSQLTSRYNHTLADSPYNKRYGTGLGKDGAGAVDEYAGRASILATPVDNLSFYGSYEVFRNKSPIAPQSVVGHEYTAYLSNPNVTDQKIDTFRGEVKYDVQNLVSAKVTYGRETYFHRIHLDLDSGTSHYAPFLPQNGGKPIVDQFGNAEIVQFEQTFVDTPWRTRSHSIEATLTSLHGGPVQWLVGGFSFKENTARDLWIDLPLTSDGIIDFNQPDREAKSNAVFGRVDWNVDDRLHLAAGARHTNDKRSDTNVNRFDSFPGNGDFAAWGSPVQVANAGVSDLGYLCGGNPALGPCSGVTPVPPGTVLNVNGGGLRIPSFFSGFAAALGSPIAQIQQIIAANAVPNATVITTPVTTAAQIAQYSQLLSNNVQVALVGPAANFPRVFSTSRESSYNDWNISGDYKLADGQFLYGTISTGHKAGSQEIFYHPRLGTFINSIVKPEDLISYEVGWKQKLNWLDGGTVSVDAFLMDYKNKQQSVFVNGGDLFCPGTFGDFNGDGYLENFVQYLGGIGIFATSAQLVNSGGATLDPTHIGVDGKPEWKLTPAAVAQVAAACSSGSTPGSLTVTTPGMPQFLELMQINLRKATIAGLEAEYSLRLSNATRVSGFATVNLVNKINDVGANQLPFTLIDALSCGDRVGGCPSIATVKGNKLPFASDVTLKLHLEHDFRINGLGGKVTTGIEGTYGSSYWLSIWNLDCYQSVHLNREVCDKGDRQGGYATLDLSARYTPDGGKYFVEAYGRNVTNTIYATNVMRAAGDQVAPMNFNTPAFFGVRVQANF